MGQHFARSREDDWECAGVTLRVVTKALETMERDWCVAGRLPGSCLLLTVNVPSRELQ